MWDLSTWAKSWRVHPFSHPGYASFSPDGSRLAVKNTGGQILVLDSASGATKHNFDNTKDGEGSGPEFSSDGQAIVDGSWAGWLRVRRTDSGAVEFEHEYPREMITAVHRTADGARWVVIHSEIATKPVHDQHKYYCSVWAWPFDRGMQYEQPLDFNGITSTDLSPDGTLLAVNHGWSPVKLSVIQLNDGAEMAAVDVQFGLGSCTVSWSPNMSCLASVQEGRVVQYTWPGLKVLSEWEVPYAADVAYAPDGGLLAIGSWAVGAVVKAQVQLCE